MGIFIKFECDKCGEYECDHSYEERRGKINTYSNNLEVVKIHKNLNIYKVDNGFLVEFPNMKVIYHSILEAEKDINKMDLSFNG
jgi:hypothetical protein